MGDFEYGSWNRSAVRTEDFSNINRVGRWVTGCRAMRQLCTARLSRNDWWSRTAVSSATLDSLPVRGSTPVHYTYNLCATFYSPIPLSLSRWLCFCVCDFQDKLYNQHNRLYYISEICKEDILHVRSYLMLTF